jgi:hypothetical protein
LEESIYRYNACIEKGLITDIWNVIPAISTYEVEKFVTSLQNVLAYSKILSDK